VPSPAEVANFQQLLATLSGKAVAAVTALWNTLQDLDPDTRWRALETAFPAVVDPFLSASGTLAAEWYSSLDPSAPFAVETAPPIPKDALAANANWALTQIDVISALAGAVERQVFNQSRETLLSNVEREGVKWARYASANACEFCRMLATRGAVYASEAAAGRVVGRGTDLSLGERRMRRSSAGLPWRPRFDNRGAAIDETAISLGGNKRRGKRGRFLAGGGGQTRGSRKLGEAYHDNCHCLPVPVREGQFYEPPDYAVGWEQDYNDATENARTKGEFGAIDVDKVLNNMRRKNYPDRKDAINARRRQLYAEQKQKQGET